MKRSYTVDFAAAQADDSPQQSTLGQNQGHRSNSGKLSSGEEQFLCSPQEEENSAESPTVMHKIDDSDIPVRRPSNHLVTAIIGISIVKVVDFMVRRVKFHRFFSADSFNSAQRR